MSEYIVELKQAKNISNALTRIENSFFMVFLMALL